MLAWGGCEPIDCSRLQKTAQRASNYQKTLNSMCLIGDNSQYNNQTGVLLYNTSKATCYHFNAGRDRTPSHSSKALIRCVGLFEAYRGLATHQQEREFKKDLEEVMIYERLKGRSQPGSKERPIIKH
ncbi:hypothetical protein NW801_21965 [Brevibacillus laterosporus]|uniref:Uncharacterized protein n=1 Tax=Brevibacillus halotolerans TaxID=1507437 RepID=A0ABT4I2W6_9BACL|nr:MULTISPECIES: hypothetical protein [Brevibacillus]MCR8987659.1 hypothetical protein [Brevibacillus laterosporus]MCZ0833398.1 hypothetical protein [Brevibacillus halotolerans]